MTIDAVHVESTEDPGTFLDRAAPLLEGDPVAHNVHVTVARDRIIRPVPGRYWWALEGDDVVGAAIHTPQSIAATLGPMRTAAAHALAGAMSDVGVPLPGVFGPAATSAEFAGCWATLRRTPAAAHDAQRVYQCADVIPTADAPGRARRATAADREFVVRSLCGFADDTGMPAVDDPGGWADVAIAAATVWLWDDGGPVSMLRATEPALGVSRVGMVFTAADRRRQGYAAALVATVTAGLLADGVDRTMLFTQLSNPTSNAVYQRVGYEPVREMLGYRFG